MRPVKLLGDGVAKVGIRNLVAVLSGNHNAINARRAAVAVLDGDLGLAIGPEEINFVGFANFGEALREAVGELDGHRHQFIGFIAGKPKHQSLIARSAGVHPHGDVRRLALDGAHDSAGIGVIAILGAIVADAANGAADKLIVINVRSGGDFAGDNGHTRGDERFAGDAALGVVLHDFVKDGIRNLVSNLVRMTFGDGLRRKKKIA